MNPNFTSYKEINQSISAWSTVVYGLAVNANLHWRSGLRLFILVITYMFFVYVLIRLRMGEVFFSGLVHGIF